MHTRVAARRLRRLNKQFKIIETKEIWEKNKIEEVKNRLFVQHVIRVFP